MTLLNYLSEKPTIGIISGFSSAGLASIQTFMLDENILKIVASLGAFGGLIVCFLTIVSLTLSIYHRIKRNEKTD